MTEETQQATQSEFITLTTRMRRRRTLTVTYNKQPGMTDKMPCIRFSGAYLDDLGFCGG